MPGIISLSILAILALGFFGVIKPLKFYVRCFVYALLIAICALYGVVSSIFFTLFGVQGLSQWSTARVFYFCCRHVFGITVNIKNPKNLTVRPAVFISNHQTELDILILGAVFPKYCSVTAKKALKYYPFLGWFSKFNCFFTFFISIPFNSNLKFSFSSDIEWLCIH